MGAMGFAESVCCFVSNDGINWGKPIATGKAQLGITTISLPSQTARSIRIMQTGENATYNWSIYELEVYRKAQPPQTKCSLR